MKSGSAKSLRQTARTELGKRDRSILADIARFRLTTNEMLHARYFVNSQPNAVVKVTSRLVRQSWLSAFPLLNRQQYFVAGTRLVKLNGLPISRSRPLGPQSLSMAYAVAKYCFATENVASPAEEAEVRTAFPWMPDELLNGIQLLEPSIAGTTLRLVRVDLGGTPEHVTKKCLHDLTVRQTAAEFNQLVAQKRFVQVVLTASATKQELIQKTIAARQWPKGMRFQVFVVPELAQLLAQT